MKKIKSIIILLLLVVMITGCVSTNNEKPKNKSYKVNGVSVSLDKEEELDKMNYLTSTTFEKDYKASSTTYTIYVDKNKDKYDLSNIKFRLDVATDIMNMESKLEREKNLVLNKDTFKNVEQDQKTINDITWEVFTFDNAYDSSTTFKEHLYITERKVDKYYYTYKIYFSYADDIEEFENAFMNNISFEE